MPRIEANLDAGLNTQDDPKRVGLNGFVELQNVRHVNGKLVKRYGTGTQSSAITGDTKYQLTNAGILVHRKLTGIRINYTNLNTIEFTDGGTTNTMTLQNVAGLVIPTGGTDLRTVFKPGDTIVIAYSGTSDNKEKALVINTVPSALVVTFTTTTEDELLNTSTSCQITFISDRDDDGTMPDNLIITNANSIDGRALITTYIDGTEMKIGMLNANNYGNMDTIAENDANSSFNGTSDMHIRMKTYTDGVRFACGLEHAPVIYKYVNRHHFNGMLKLDYNSDAHTMYPTWYLDTAVPIVEANTFVINNSSASELMNTNERVWELDGTLDTTNNVYEYKFVPVYDGTQEDLLENAAMKLSTASLQGRKIEKSGALGIYNNAIKIEGKIDLQKLNPRMSSLNVYRNTNGGTFYKIKSIYMGDNDLNQQSQTFYGGDDVFAFKGDTDPGPSTLDATQMIVDGFMYGIENTSTPSLNHLGTGYNLAFVEEDSSAEKFGKILADDANMSPEYYGSYHTSKWNHPCEATDIIYADNGEARGGSANGGWYFANASEKNTAFSVSDAIASSTMTIAADDTATAGPFTAAFANANQGDGSNCRHYSITNTGGQNESMKRWVLGTSVSETSTYIVSGWIRAEGFNSADAKWRVFVSGSDGHDQYSAEGQGDIAHGTGGSDNQNIDKWRWFQLEVENPDSTSLHIYAYIYAPNVGCDQNKIYMKAVSVREKVANFGLTDNLIGYCGKNIGISSTFKDLGFSPGTLKGNSIQRDDDNPNYPTKDYTDRTIITDNNGAFIRTSTTLTYIGEGEGVTRNDNCFFGTSNYQFFSNSTGGASNNDMNRYMLMDFYDPGLPDGARHPNDGITSLDVKFKYATMLNGRQFVANVKITGDEDTEEYPNFVMYSNPGAPDIIPTSNFIKLDDLQGGEIVGIETLMSDIVVFMTKGIFRINVPTGDPTNWSLVEAHPNIGCLHDKGITKAPNGIFFLSQEDVIFLDSGFSATPITFPIRDEYQANVASNSAIMRTHYDVKYNKLYITKTVSTNTEFWTYDILRQTWATEKHSGVEYDEFALDNDNNTLLIESAADGSGDAGDNSYISRAVDTSEYRDDNGSGSRVAIDMIAKTGEQELTPYDQNAYIRRVNTNTNKGGGTELDLEVIAGTTVTKSNFLDGAQSTRTSQRAQKAQVKVSDDVNQDNVKEISRIEVEYE